MKKSFTLVELIIVLAVTSTMTVFSVGQYSNVTADSKLVKVKSDLKTVKDATVQYLAKTDHIPINNTGIGIPRTDFNLSEAEYVMLNLDLLAREQLLPNNTKIPACIQNVPPSALYTKAGVKNVKKQEPSFIYVMDKNLNVYLARADKDTVTGYFIHTKIYETLDAKTYDNTVKMSYVGNKPIIEQALENADDEDTGTESTIIGSNIQISPDISINDPEVGQESGGATKEVNKLYYQNLSVAGFNVFLDAYDVDLSKIKSVDMSIKAGDKTIAKTLYTVKSTRWFGIVESKELDYYSGNYECNIYAVDKNDKKIAIGDFTVLIDRVKPTVNIEKSKNDFYSNSPIVVTLTSSDAAVSSGIKELKYKINDEEWTEYTEPFILDKPDYYEIQAKATDNFDNRSKIATSIINNFSNPEIYLTKTATGVNINLGVDIADEDILWQNGFETTDKYIGFGQCNTPKYGVNGGQFYATEQKFEGSRSYLLKKNDDGNGNIYFFPYTSSNTTRMNLGSLGKTVLNNMYLSMTYRYKSYGNSTVRANLDGSWGRKVRYYNCTILENVPVGSKTIKLDSLSGLALNSVIFSDTNDLSVGGSTSIRTMDKTTNTITVSNSLPRELKAGEKLSYRYWRGGGSFANNTTGDTGGEWRLFTTVMKTTNYDDYDLYQYGTGAFLFQSTASNELYLDNVKMGYASRIILYKNGERFNTTAQEYSTAYTDNNIPDKNSPKINDINIGKTSNNYIINIDAIDEGTVYEYYMETISRKGTKNESKKRTITTTSGIKQYYYVIDNNASTAVVPTTQSTPDPVINTTLDKNKSWYIHLVAEDNSANKSQVYHKQIN